VSGLHLRWQRDALFRPPPYSGAKHNIWLAAVVSVSLFVASIAAATVFHAELEYPVVVYVNTFTTAYPALDYAMTALTKVDLTQGVVLVAMVWWLWSAKSAAERPRLLMGVAAASAAALVSRALQIVLPTHLRPLHDPALHLLLPLNLAPATFNHFNSFPSDHASLLFGIAAAIWIIDRRVGVAALLWASVVVFSRVYEMIHFPSDIVGGAALGVFAVCVSQNRMVLAGGRLLLRWERRSAAWFYMTAFVASYLVATMFDGVRMLGKGAFKMVLLHFLNT
jgi:membrane-associated phospholipid phosphatase